MTNKTLRDEAPDPLSDVIFCHSPVHRGLHVVLCSPQTATTSVPVSLNSVWSGVPLTLPCFVLPLFKFHLLREAFLDFPLVASITLCPFIQG